MDGITELARMFGKQPDEAQKTATATVSRIADDGTIYATIPGGAGEFPVNKTTVDVSAGDTVTVRIENGRASIDGSTSAPSISAARANELMTPISEAAARAAHGADVAQAMAESATESAAEAGEKAAQISTLLDGVEEAAEAADKTVAEMLVLGTQAKSDAELANRSAKGALLSLSEVESVVGTLNWISEHATFGNDLDAFDPAEVYYVPDPASPKGYSIVAEPTEAGMFSYALTEDESIEAGKVYYTRSGSGTEADPYVYTEVAEPDVSEISTYYERSCDYYVMLVDKSVQSYIASHLAQTDYGLDLMVDGSDLRMHLGTIDGAHAIGAYMIDQTGAPVAKFGSDVQIGAVGNVHIEVRGDRFSFFSGGCGWRQLVEDDWFPIVESPTGNPSTNGYYVSDGTGCFVPSTDTTVVSGTVYHTSNVEPDKPVTGEVAFITVDPDREESVFYIAREVVVRELRFGKWQFDHRDNGNLTLRWMGAANA